MTAAASDLVLDAAVMHTALVQDNPARLPTPEQAADLIGALSDALAAAETRIGQLEEQLLGAVDRPVTPDASKADTSPGDRPLQPGERIVNGQRMYSAAWLSDPKGEA